MNKSIIFILSLIGFGDVIAQDVFWSEDFGTGTCAFRNQLAINYASVNGPWTQSIMAAEGGVPNQFFVSPTEAFTGGGNCSNSCIGNSTLTNQTLHVGSLGVGLCPAGDCGAVYNFGSNGETHKRIESPTIDCTGKHDITVSFDYMMFGELNTDAASFGYFDGVSWTNLAVPLNPQTSCCGGPCGTLGASAQWSQNRYNINLPPSANNNPNVKIAFLWDNDLNNLGADPSFAVDNVELSVPPASYFVGGDLSGLLTGNDLLLQNNGVDDLSLSDDGAFAFVQPIEVGEDYAVTIVTTPINPIQPCKVINGSGTISNQDITDVVVSCEVGDDLIFRDGF